MDYDPDNRRDYADRILDDPNFQIYHREISCGPLSIALLIGLFIGLLVLIVFGTAHLSGQSVTFGTFWPSLPIILLGQATALATPRIARLFRRPKEGQEETRPWTLAALLLSIVLLIALLALMPSIMTAFGGPHVDAIPVWESLLGSAIGIIIAQVGYPLYRRLRRKKNTFVG